MEISEKATLTEKSKTMYSTAKNEAVTWIDWAKYFVKTCQELGLEVVTGPGTSLGVVFPGSQSSYAYGDEPVNYDCDWTQENGICLQWQDYASDIYNGWFYGITPWSIVEQQSNYGIDEENGRFDIIVYLAENPSQEKIGVRIKYPVCSVGFNYQNWNGSILPHNYLQTVPIFTIYSSLKENIEISPEGLLGIRTGYGSSSGHFLNGYFYIFGKSGIDSILTKCGLRFDENENKWVDCVHGTNDTDRRETYVWSLDIQKGLNFYYNYAKTTSASGPPYVITNRDDLAFIKTWRKFNEFNYHYSASGDTFYFYIANPEENKVGVKVIATTLENGEKAVMIESNNPNSENTLCECVGYTENFYTIPTQDKSNHLFLLPNRPYKVTVFNGNEQNRVTQFSLSRTLLPGQKVLCNDLYFIVKRDTNETVGEGVYILVRDKNGQSHYFRVIPFGSRQTYEVSGDNTTYLAFPVADPNDTGD